MSAYRVIVLARADRDVQSIFAWLWSRSPKGAERWLAAFESAKEKLAEDPARLALIPENVRSSYEIRHVLFKTRRGRVYRAIFASYEFDVLRSDQFGDVIFPKDSATLADGRGKGKRAS